jgi:hypothetical protein
MAESDDLRAFIRDLMARFDRSMGAVLKEQRAAREESRRYFAAIEARQVADRERLDEIIAEGRAGREALFRILDRMDGNGGTAPAA